jgi:hypothetical protein
MYNFVFWVKGFHGDVVPQLLLNRRKADPFLTEFEKHIQAHPPILIKPEHEDLEFSELVALYPLPEKG